MALNRDGTVVKRTGDVRKGTSTTVNRPGAARGLPSGAGGARAGSDNSPKQNPVPRKQR
jgi:hypothetical protein